MTAIRIKIIGGAADGQDGYLDLPLPRFIAVPVEDPDAQPCPEHGTPMQALACYVRRTDEPVYVPSNDSDTRFLED